MELEMQLPLASSKVEFAYHYGSNAKDMVNSVQYPMLTEDECLVSNVLSLLTAGFCVVRDQAHESLCFSFFQSWQGATTPPVAVTIFFGANDAALLSGTGKRQHVPLDEYKENLRKMVQHIKERSPETLVVLISPPPIDLEGRQEYARTLYGEKASEVPDRTNEVAGTYAEQCVSLAKELGLPSVNLWSKMQETNGWQKKFLSDGLHLKPEGNAVVFQEVVKIFDEAGFSDLPFDFPQHSEIDEENPEKAFLQQCPAA